MTVAAFLWRFARRYMHWLGVAAAAILVFGLATAALVSLIEPIFEEVLLAEEETPEALRAGPAPGEADAVDESPGISRAGLKAALDRAYVRFKEWAGVTPENVLYALPLLLVALFILRALADFLSGYSFQVLGLGVTTDIRNELYRRILDQSSRFHARHPSGELVSRVVNDVAVMQNAVSNRLFDLVQQSFTLVVLLILLLSTHLKLALISLIAAPLLLVPIVRFGRGMRRTSHRSQERMADLANLVAEGVRGHRVVKAFGMEGFEHGRFRQATRRHLRVNLWAQVLTHASSPVVESLAVTGSAALLIYAGYAIRQGELSASLFVAFLFNLLALYDPIRKLNKVNLILQQSLAAVHRIHGVIQEPDEVADRPSHAPLTTVREGVRFENVRFRYEEEEVLRGIDLTIRRGEIVALVGPSGAGKSTLVSLLPRFFDPDGGRITIDGVDLRDLPLDNLRSLIGMVTQETLLFNDTVRSNIAYGRVEVPVERVREAAAAAYADEFIVQLPEGYDTVIGEGGLKLSGGQRQRLAIARALLKNAPILILDEATSQLDTESEAVVQKALTNLMQGRTTLVIAHRLSTVMRATRIAVIERGRIVEEGSHAELLAGSGAYKRLYDLQFQA